MYFDFTIYDVLKMKVSILLSYFTAVGILEIILYHIYYVVFKFHKINTISCCVRILLFFVMSYCVRTKHDQLPLLTKHDQLPLLPFIMYTFSLDFSNSLLFRLLFLIFFSRLYIYIKINNNV